MKLSLRAKFLMWLLVLIAAIYVAFGAALFAFNLHERCEHPDEVEEEREELFIIYGLMAAVLPLAVGGAWVITGKLLEPLRSMLLTARQIQQGGLGLRVKTPVAEDELGQLASALNDGFDNYQRVLRRIDRFSLDAAHQLRNPLSSIRTAGEVCLERERSPAEYRDTISGMVEDAGRLSHTVDQLLLLARLTRADLSISFEPVLLSELVVDLLNDLKPAFEAAHVRLEARMDGGPFSVRGSPRLIEQAVSNLLDNALRFTPRDGTVLVEISRDASDVIALSVSDSGPGLARQGAAIPDSPELHQSAGEAKEGNRLGLMVVQDIIHAHGGTMQAARSQWGGAAFRLEFNGKQDQPMRQKVQAT